MRLIDAEAFKSYMRGALEQTRRCYPDSGEWAEAVTEEFCRDIDEQPTVQPETHWIPCSERLPDNYDYQLLTEEVHYTTGKIVRCVLIAYYDDEDDVWMSAEESPEAISYPIAWMPLPEPYKGGDE